MAGTRGLATFRGEQLRSYIMRDRHFDEDNKINENKIDLKWHNHREILEDTKIDVFVQANDKAVAGLNSIDVTSIIGGKLVSTDITEEGVVLESKVEMRQTGSEDYPYIDADGDRVYGKLRFVNNDAVSVDGESVATADGLQTDFNLAFGNVVPGTLVVYFDGAPQTGNYTTDYVNGTTNFSTAPVDGTVITADYQHDQDGNGQYFLDFFSEVSGAEASYTFAGDAINADFRYILRTNLSVIPVDSLVQGGSGFVEGATDANAYMNLNQLMKDIYEGGTLDNDGNANLTAPLTKQIADEVQARKDADTSIRNDLASTLDAEGASLVGVVADVNHNGLTVQDAITDLAQRIVASEEGGLTEVTNTHSRELESENGYFSERSEANGGEFTSLEERILDVENTVDTQMQDKEIRVTKLETEDQRFVFEAVGGETEVLIPGGLLARPNTLFMSLNGGIQAPGVNFDELTDVDGNVTGVNFDPDKLSSGDVVFIWYKRVF